VTENADLISTQPQRARQGDLRLVALIGAVSTATVLLDWLGIGSLPDLVELPGPPGLLLFLLLAVGFAAAEVAMVNVPIGRSAFTLTLTEIPLVVGLFVLPPTHLVAARVLGALIPLVLRTRGSVLKVAFNLANYSLEVIVLLLVWHLALDGAAPLSPWG
jgi:hypothetical protein